MIVHEELAALRACVADLREQQAQLVEIVSRLVAEERPHPTGTMSVSHFARLAGLSARRARELAPYLGGKRATPRGAWRLPVDAVEAYLGAGEEKSAEVGGTRR